MAIAALDLSFWWLAGIMGTVTIVVLSVILMPGMGGADGKKQVAREQTKEERILAEAARKRAAKKEAARQDSGRLEDEPWFPQLEFKDWQDAGQLPGCPWCFDGCDSTEDVIKSIWRAPLNKGLQQALGALLSRVKKVRVARVNFRATDECFFAAVYTLNSGAELFGGQPLEQAVGLDLDDEGPGEVGLRRRHGGGPGFQSSEESEANDIDLPCLAPFYRIHDGFGCLLSSKHLPIVLTNPSDTIQGSCFYVYPVRCLETIAGSSYLAKFARVDKACVACADRREMHPHVVFAESNGQLTEEDEAPLDFVADTVCNIAGQKVVPDSLQYHAYSLSNAGSNAF